MSIFVSILGLGFLILIHEAGHFFVARRVGMNPRKFYLGFPPALVKTKRNGIEYGVGAIPLGGYVKIPGMHRPAAGDLDIHFGRAVEEDPSLRRRWSELRARLEESDYAGARDAVARLASQMRRATLSPVALKTVERGLGEMRRCPGAGRVLAREDLEARRRHLRRARGEPRARRGPLRGPLHCAAATGRSSSRRGRIDEIVRRARPPRQMGLQAGRSDRRDQRRAGGGRRDRGRHLELRRRADHGSQSSGATRRSTLGPTRPRRQRRVPLGFVLAAKGSGRSSRLASRARDRDRTKEIGASVGRLVTGDGREEISSPVGIVQGSSEAVEQGADTYLWVLGLISLSLALLNLLPLLPLDGGHIAFSLIEGIRGKAVAREVYERVSVVGIAVVLLLFFIGLSNDIGRLGN